MRIVFCGTLALAFFAVASLAQTVDEAIEIAQSQGVCDPFGVASASVGVDGTIFAKCNEDVTAIVPLLGGLAPVLGLGATAAVASALQGGNATPDTQ